jgi:hypothetical protein
LRAKRYFGIFLTEVVCLDSNNYTIDKFSEVQDETDGLSSGSPKSTIYATLSNKQVTLNVVMNISERKIRYYDLTVESGSLDGSYLKNNDFLSVGKKMLGQYKAAFGTSYIVMPEYVRANYVDDFIRLIPTTIQAEKVSVDKEKMLLTVDFSKGTGSQEKYAKFVWCQKVDDYTDPVLLFQTVFAKTGVLTSFIDNMGVYTVATTRVTLSEQDAIALARSFIDEYAMANSQTVKTIKTELAYVKDYYNERGYSHLAYPKWSVEAIFNTSNTKSAHGVYGYSVLIWADSGEIESHGAQGMR